MKTSELIEHLQLILKEKGDLTVLTSTDNQFVAKPVQSCVEVLFLDVCPPEVCVKISQFKDEIQVGKRTKL